MDNKALRTEPFMYAIMRPDGTAHLDEGCVARCADDLTAEAASLSEGFNLHQVVPVYLGQLDDAAVTLEKVYAAFGIGRLARTPGALMANLGTALRFSSYLSAVERELLMVPGEPSDEPEDEGCEPDDVCLVNSWGAASVESYVEQFRKALAQIAPARAAADTGEREAIARAIWSVRREHEDRYDMELEDLGGDHPVWAEADAVILALPATRVEVTPAIGSSQLDEVIERLTRQCKNADLALSAQTGNRDVARARLEALEELLRLARQFVINGIEQGYITMPDPETPDPAHDLIPLIDAVLAGSKQESLFDKGKRLFAEGKGISCLWGECRSDEELPEVHRGYNAAAEEAAQLKEQGIPGTSFQALNVKANEGDL